jgi:Uma2 family endonuclease
MSIAAKSQVSEAEFLSLPESLERIELIDGEVVVSPSPIFWHQEVLARLFVALRTWAEGRPEVTVAQAPLDVRFGPNRILQPDLMVFLSRLPRTQTGPIVRIPEICVEVLSTNRVYDRVTKRFIYGAAGVAEYWIVDPAGYIERRTGPELIDEDRPEHLTSPLLPEFGLDVAKLLADIR